MGIKPGIIVADIAMRVMKQSRILGSLLCTFLVLAVLSPALAGRHLKLKKLGKKLGIAALALGGLGTRVIPLPIPILKSHEVVGQHSFFPVPQPFPVFLPSHPPIHHEAPLLPPPIAHPLPIAEPIGHFGGGHFGGGHFGGGQFGGEQFGGEQFGGGHFGGGQFGGGQFGGGQFGGGHYGGHLGGAHFGGATLFGGAHFDGGHFGAHIGGGHLPAPLPEPDFHHGPIAEPVPEPAW